MASFTKYTKFRRKLRRNKMGRDRKHAAQVNGTTPAFPIHTPEADKNAPPEQVSPANRD